MRIQQHREAARESGAVLYVVAIGDRDVLWPAPPDVRSNQRDPPFVEILAHLTGGRLLLSGSATGLRDAFLTILAETRTRYLLSYVPRDTRAGWHELTVKLRGAKGEVRARRGYLRRPPS